jgi:hypothetical protein
LESFFSTTYLIYDVEDINYCIQTEDGIVTICISLNEFNTDKDVFKEYNNEVIKNYHSIIENIISLTKQKG